MRKIADILRKVADRLDTMSIQKVKVDRNDTQRVIAWIDMVRYYEGDIIISFD